MKLSKKALSLILVLAMVASFLTVPAFAANEGITALESVEVKTAGATSSDADQVNITFTYEVTAGQDPEDKKISYQFIGLSGQKDSDVKETTELDVTGTGTGQTDDEEDVSVTGLAPGKWKVVAGLTDDALTVESDAFYLTHATTGSDSADVAKLVYSAVPVAMSIAAKTSGTDGIVVNFGTNPAVDVESVVWVKGGDKDDEELTSGNDYTYTNRILKLSAAAGTKLDSSTDQQDFIVTFANGAAFKFQGTESTNDVTHVVAATPAVYNKLNDVSFDSDAIVGKDISLTPTYTENAVDPFTANEDVTYMWYRSDNYIGNAVELVNALAKKGDELVTEYIATGATYKPAKADIGKYLCVFAFGQASAIEVVKSTSEVDDGKFKHNIEYPDKNAANNIEITIAAEVDAVTADDKGKGSATIDLTAETLTVPDTFTVKAYSLDNGAKWKSGSIGSKDGQDISKLLNKGMTLVLASQDIDKATKKPIAGVAKVEKTDDTAEVPAVVGASYITFPTIGGRPKADKLSINYGALNDDVGFGEPGQWTLSEKGSTTASTTLGLLQIAVAEDKKNPDEKGWGTFIDYGDGTFCGIAVKPLPADGKPVKTVYLVRLAPVASNGVFTPASKSYKVTASSQIKAPKLKADYKKEIIKPKADLQIARADAPIDGKYTDAAIAAGLPILEDRPVSESLPDGVVSYSKDQKEAIKAGYDISGLLTEHETAVMVQQKGTAKKPSSGVQTIILAPRARLEDATLKPNNGKLKLVKGFEAFNTSKGKYGGLPKITAAGNVLYRMKTTAKATKDGKYSGLAASKDGILYYEWGTYNSGEKKEKSGVTAATVIGPNYKDGIIDLYVVDTLGITTAGVLEVTFAVKGVPSSINLADGATAAGLFAADLDGVKGTVTHQLIAADNQPYFFNNAENTSLALPGIKVAFDGTSGIKPGNLKVTGTSAVGTGKDISKVNPATVAVDLNDAAKADLAKEIIEAYGANDIAIPKDGKFKDEDTFKGEIEKKLNGDSKLPKGGIFEVNVETKGHETLKATVTIKYGTMESGIPANLDLRANTSVLTTLPNGKYVKLTGATAPTAEEQFNFANNVLTYWENNADSGEKKIELPIGADAEQKFLAALTTAADEFTIQDGKVTVIKLAGAPTGGSLPLHRMFLDKALTIDTTTVETTITGDVPDTVITVTGTNKLTAKGTFTFGAVAGPLDVDGATSVVTLTKTVTGAIDIKNDAKVIIAEGGAAGNALTITKGTVTIAGNVTVAEDITLTDGALTIANGAKLTVEASKTLTVAQSKTLTVDGTLVVTGTLTVTGTMIVNGTVTNNGEITVNSSSGEVKLGVGGTIVTAGGSKKITVSGVEVTTAASGDFTITGVADDNDVEVSAGDSAVAAESQSTKATLNAAVAVTVKAGEKLEFEISGSNSSSAALSVADAKITVTRT